MCVIAQKNEEGVRSSEGYSPNVKGGGDAGAAADFLLQPRIDPELNGVLNVRLTHSRHTATGGGTHTLNRSSGLILDRWVRDRPIAF